MAERELAKKCGGDGCDSHDGRSFRALVHAVAQRPEKHGKWYEHRDGPGEALETT